MSDRPAKSLQDGPWSVLYWGTWMKSKSLIMLFVSLGFGLVAAIGISQVMGRNKSGGEEAVQKISIVVAKTAIDYESALNDETVAIEEWPINIAPEDAVQSMAELENMVVASRVLKGLPLVKSNLVNRNQVRTLPIPPGKKVIAIPLDSDDTINGMLQPGDRVDIIGVFKENSGGQQISTPRTFLKNIKVFSVGDSYKRDLLGETTGAKGKTNVGVLVNEKQSEALVLALGSNTKLKIVMRADTGNEESELVMGPEELAAEESSDSGMGKMFTSLLGSQNHGFRTVIWEGADRTIVNFDGNGNIIEPESGMAPRVSPTRMAPLPFGAGGQPGASGSDSAGHAGSGNTAEDDNSFEEVDA